MISPTWIDQAPNVIGPRRWHVLNKLSEGLSMSQIAAAGELSLSVVMEDVRFLRRWYGVRSVLELGIIGYALQVIAA